MSVSHHETWQHMKRLASLFHRPSSLTLGVFRISWVAAKTPLRPVLGMFFLAGNAKQMLFCISQIFFPSLLTNLCHNLTNFPPKKWSDCCSLGRLLPIPVSTSRCSFNWTPQRWFSKTCRRYRKDCTVMLTPLRATGPGSSKVMGLGIQSFA